MILGGKDEGEKKNGVGFWLRMCVLVLGLFFDHFFFRSFMYFMLLMVLRRLNRQQISCVIRGCANDFKPFFFSFLEISLL